MLAKIERELNEVTGETCFSDCIISPHRIREAYFAFLTTNHDDDPMIVIQWENDVQISIEYSKELWQRIKELIEEGKRETVYHE